MSDDFFAILRFKAGEDTGKLAEEHFKHDLQDSDRDALKTAFDKARTYTMAGSCLGLGLGLLLAFRIRSSRTRMFNAFRSAEKPTHVKFADGMDGNITNMASPVKRTILGGIATYFLCGAGGIVLGIQTGAFTGYALGTRAITKGDPDSRARIAAAFKSFRADMRK